MQSAGVAEEEPRGRQRAAALAASAGIKACAVAEAARTPQPTHLPPSRRGAALTGGADKDEEESEEEGSNEAAEGAGSAGGSKRLRRSRTLDGRRKDPAKVAAALLSRQRLVRLAGTCWGPLSREGQALGPCASEG